MRLRRERIDTGDLDMRSGERMIAACQTTAGAAVAATDRALYPPGGDRLPWSAIARAEWQEPFLVITTVDAHGRPADRLRLELGEEPGYLAAAVHDRVTASVVVTERATLPCGAGALFTARQDSDDGTIRWSVVFDAGIDPGDPQVRAEATAKLADLRTSLGI